MSVLQKIFDMSARAISTLDAKVEKNDQKVFKRLDDMIDGEGVFTKIGGGLASYFGPATWCGLAETLAEVPFILVRDAVETIAKKTGHPLNTSLRL